MDSEPWNELEQLRGEQSALEIRLRSPGIRYDLPEQARVKARIAQIEERRDDLLREMAENLA